MIKIKCLIVDDEPVAQRIIEGYLAEFKEFHLVGKYLNAIEASKVLQELNVDLLFLDLEMPKLKGYSFLKTLNKPPAVIITTAHREHALEGFEIGVLDYLLKPISFPRFVKAMNRYKNKYLLEKNLKRYPPSTDYLYIKSDRKTFKIDKTKILFVEGMNNYIKIHLDDRRFVAYYSLTQILKDLGESFVRIHKSYIINKNKISAFSKENIEINNLKIPVGGTYKEAIDLI